MRSRPAGPHRPHAGHRPRAVAPRASRCRPRARHETQGPGEPPGTPLWTSPRRRDRVLCEPQRRPARANGRPGRTRGQRSPGPTGLAAPGCSLEATVRLDSKGGGQLRASPLPGLAARLFTPQLGSSEGPSPATSGRKQRTKVPAASRKGGPPSASLSPGPREGPPHLPGPRSQPASRPRSPMDRGRLKACPLVPASPGLAHGSPSFTTRLPSATGHGAGSTGPGAAGQLTGPGLLRSHLPAPAERGLRLSSWLCHGVRRPECHREQRRGHPFRSPCWPAPGPGRRA